MKVVTLRVYRGQKMSYEADGSVQNENQLIKLNEGLEFDKFEKLIGAQGYCKVDLVDVKEIRKNGVIANLSEAAMKVWQDRVVKMLTPEEIKPLTVSDLSKRLDELEKTKNAEIEKLRNELKNKA